MVQNYYIKYCDSQTVIKKKAKTIKSVKPKKNDFILNPKLATKTLYNLLYSQQKYSDAYNVLLIMKKNKKNKVFVLNAMKLIKEKLLKG